MLLFLFTTFKLLCTLYVEVKFYLWIWRYRSNIRLICIVSMTPYHININCNSWYIYLLSYSNSTLIMILRILLLIQYWNILVKCKWNIIILRDANQTKIGREESSVYVNYLISIYTWSSLSRKVVDSLFHDLEGAAFLPELSMVLISDNTIATYWFTNNERWVHWYITTRYTFYKTISFAFSISYCSYTSW